MQHETKPFHMVLEISLIGEFHYDVESENPFLAVIVARLIAPE